MVKEGIAAMEQKLASLRCNDSKHNKPSNKKKTSSNDKKSKSNVTKKQKSEEKDPNAPKRPKNAFAFYAQSIRAQVRKENTNLAATENVSNLSVSIVFIIMYTHIPILSKHI